jgi:hypothetical protein
MMFSLRRPTIQLLAFLCLICFTNEKLSAQGAGNTLYAAPAASDETYREYESSGQSDTKSYNPKPKYNYSGYTYALPVPEAAAYIINDTVIELGTRALMNVRADSYVAIFGTSQIAESLDSCNKLLNDRINSFTKRLLALGINKNDISIDFVSQIPVFEYEIEKKLFSKKYNEIPKGFELKKNIHIGYKKNSLLDDILTEAAKNEIYDVIKVDNIIDHVEAIYDTLRDATIKTLNKKTEDMKKLGIKFFTAKFTVVAEDMRCFYPIDRYKSYTSFSNVSLGGKKTSSSATVHQVPKTLSLYYDKVPYGAYDVVINPKLIEPSAQFTYNIKIRYTYKSEQIKSIIQNAPGPAK